MNLTIRKIRLDDVQHIKNVLDTIELFPSDFLEDMISDFFNNPKTKDIWFTVTSNDVPISLGYCAPEKFTEGTYNLYAIGVKAESQGKGIGHKMMAYLEAELAQKGARILLVETSGSDDYKLTRNFYAGLGYKKEATIRDFWNEGEDKVIFWKKIN